MAKNVKSVVEAVNADVTANWEVKSRIDISSAAHGYLLLSSASNNITIYSDSEVYFNFTTDIADSISTTKDLILPANTLISLRIPRGLSGRRVCFHVKQTTSAATKYLRIVEG